VVVDGADQLRDGARVIVPGAPGAPGASSGGGQYRRHRDGASSSGANAPAPTSTP
jgi:hypothetical protein